MRRKETEILILIEKEATSKTAKKTLTSVEKWPRQTRRAHRETDEAGQDQEGKETAQESAQKEEISVKLIYFSIIFLF